MSSVPRSSPASERKPGSNPKTCDRSRPERALSVAGDVVVLDDVYEEDCAGFDPEDDPVAAVDAGFRVELLRMNRLYAKSRRGLLLDEREGGAITGSLALRAQVRIGLLPSIRPYRGKEGLLPSHPLLSRPGPPLETVQEGLRLPG